jgi:hypothetical protein
MTRCSYPLGADELEASLLVDRTCSVVDERVVHPLLTDLVRVPLDHTATLRCNQIERTGQSHLGVALSAVTPVDEDACDAVIGHHVGLSEVLLAVMDGRQLIRGAVLRPRDRLIANHHQRRMSLSGLD